jgi:hypothetical protein
MRTDCRRQPRPGDKWHLDEVFIKIQGKTHYLWRAVDQDGNVLDILVTSRRNANEGRRGAAVSDLSPSVSLGSLEGLDGTAVMIESTARSESTPERGQVCAVAAPRELDETDI